MACLTEELVVNGPGVNRSLSRAGGGSTDGCMCWWARYSEMAVSASSYQNWLVDWSTPTGPLGRKQPRHPMRARLRCRGMSAAVEPPKKTWTEAELQALPD